MICQAVFCIFCATPRMGTKPYGYTKKRTKQPKREYFQEPHFFPFYFHSWKLHYYSAQNIFLRRRVVCFFLLTLDFQWDVTDLSLRNKWLLPQANEGTAMFRGSIAPDPFCLPNLPDINVIGNAKTSWRIVAQKQETRVCGYDACER